MPILKLSEKLTLHLKQKLIPKLKLAEFITLPEKKFYEFIAEVENDPLFKKLMYPKNREEKTIRYEKFLHAAIPSNFYELKEEMLEERTIPEIDTLLENKKEIIRICQKLGIERFNKYFFYNEDSLSAEEISSLCGLSSTEVEKIIDLVNEVAVQTEFYYPSTLNPEKQFHYTKIAAVEKNGNNNLTIGFFSPAITRGRYSINYKKIEQLKKTKFFTPEEKRKLNKLLQNLELINQRKTTIYQILEKIIEIQENYLHTGESNALVPFAQKELANKIGIHPSLISRAIRGRSILTPWQEEIPLKYFFPSKKEIRKNLIREIIASEERPCSDEEIKNKLKTEYNVTISRRSINNYRQELKISSKFKRG